MHGARLRTPKSRSHRPISLLFIFVFKFKSFYCSSRRQPAVSTKTLSEKGPVLTYDGRPVCRRRTNKDLSVMNQFKHFPTKRAARTALRTVTKPPQQAHSSELPLVPSVLSSQELDHKVCILFHDCRAV